MLFGHLAVIITVIISGKLCPAFDNFIVYVVLFLLTRDGFLNHSPMKPAVFYQLLSKSGMFTFSYKMPFLMFFPWGSKQDFWLFGGRI